MTDPTRDTYDHLNRAYQRFNDGLFEGRLAPCLITLRARGNSNGYFHANRFVHPDKRTSHEIALNPECWAYRTIEQCLSTLVHEMVHLHQHEDGKAPRRGYHDADWADRMEKVGLMPSSTGAPGGNRTGDKVSHYIQPGGPYFRVARKLIDDDFRARWSDRILARISPEWTPGKPARIPGDLPADQMEQVLSKAVAAGASPMSLAPAPDYTPEGLEKYLSELSLTAHPGGDKPLLATSSETFVLPAPKRPPRAKDPSKTKFTCPTCKAAAWGKASLQLVCGKCMCNMGAA